MDNPIINAMEQHLCPDDIYDFQLYTKLREIETALEFAIQDGVCTEVKNGLMQKSLTALDGILKQLHVPTTGEENVHD